LFDDLGCDQALFRSGATQFCPEKSDRLVAAR
jgi:hypothetical protein